MKTQLEGFSQKASTGQYPGGKEIEQGRTLLAGLIQIQTSYQFIEQFIASGDDLQDFQEDFEDLENFYDSQFATWQRLERALSIDFERNRKFLDADETASKAIIQLEAIYNKERPYRDIRHIDPLIETD